MSTTLDAIRACLDGAIPAVIATCAPDGTPNVAYASQVEIVDCDHVALSFQFFNKTHQNVLAHPLATVLVIHPQTAARYRLYLRFERTETEGALFQRMKARLAGIASHTGMSGVFRLLGADIYRVLRIERIDAPERRRQDAERNLLPAVRLLTQRIAAATDMDALFEQTLDGLDRHFGVGHAMILLCDRARTRLYTVASRGYAASGVGSEIPFGAGIVGVVAQYRTSIRINHKAAEYAYGRAVREAALGEGAADALETAIPFPGLAEPGSQLAVPVEAGGELLGVLYAESAQDLRFSHDDEDALGAVAAALGVVVRALRDEAESEEAAEASAPAAPAADVEPVTVRRYRRDNSIFLGDDYLIKGVAGAILWRLLSGYVQDGRVDYSNRELRLDPAIGLPDVVDNLEARLILLAKRLSERADWLGIDKTGRGRFRLRVARPVQLVEHAAG
ncbi:putative phosphoenolpyruvate-protein phosphotransferase [Mizugakiibacter sediminis]|uniref:Histidine kinase n=1 Tax=Mizugakiibacter sediminis TaxID=1475481 RepID=A0A0K8QLH6_9GAMM|nr:GAF domain-containing protein [Mizugakiibacter sediminis]GAP65785.1 putative phosphoenolpyruvate-protein phosphotransferase [Mizugakiibacter sediminis]